MKYEIILSNQFRKDLKLASKRGYRLDLLEQVVNILANGDALPLKNRDHELTGNYSGFR